ncbi:MAG: SDR family oxidoreductase [Saprospiraceae bacterium]|nr:SDR family oxidoreductase [Saprospiraceae bacterium]
MKIAIIGGTGLIGSQLATMLQDKHEVVAASPSTGVNTLTKEGLDEALQGADVVIDVSNSPSFADDEVMAFFKTSTENLLAAEAKAGIKHHILLSVVGTQQLQKSGYFRAKNVQEKLVKASGIPFTIVHATQFFEFAGAIAHLSSLGGKVVVPDAFVQPIASAEVASFLAKTATEMPANSVVEIGGPKRVEMANWIKQYLEMMKNPVEVVADSNALYFGASIKQSTLVPNAPIFWGNITYAEWLSKTENRR